MKIPLSALIVSNKTPIAKTLSNILIECEFYVKVVNPKLLDKNLSPNITIFIKEGNDFFIDEIIDFCTSVQSPLIVYGTTLSSENECILEYLDQTSNKDALIAKFKVYHKLLSHKKTSNCDDCDKKIKELLILKEKAESANETKNFFLANVSHEIKTPLTGIKGFIEMLEETPLTSEQMEYVRYAGMSSKKLDEIVTDILDYTELETVGYIKNERPFKLSSMIERTVSFVKIDAIHKKLTIDSTFSGDISEILIGDESRIRQVLISLLDNAIKFTDEGAIHISINVIEKKQNSEIIQVSVKDSGIGIKQEKQQIIFEKFFQIDESHERKHGGLGLGLAISKQLIDNMGGHIWVESKEGEGSVFTFELELKKADEKLLPNAITKSTKKNKEILIVEDNPINLKIFNLMLEKLGHKTFTADNGLKAVALIQKKRFDLIFMDVQMPELNGLEATIKIREFEKNKKRHTPIIAFTAHSTSRDKEACMEAGMDDILLKPIQKSTLNSILATYLP